MRWLTFDLDGTLADWPFSYIIRPHMRKLVEKHPQLGPALNEEYRRRLTLDQPERIFDWGDIHRAVEEKLALDIRFPDIPKLLDEATFGDGMVYPDVWPGLEAFKSQGWQIAIATNGLAKYQQPLIDKLGIPYDFMLAPDIAQATKPNPGFWNPLKPTQVSRMVHVGDLLTHDIWGANTTGLEGAWIWREMPTSWRNTPVQERLKRGDYAEVIQAVTQKELEEHGFLGSQPATTPPKPDYIVADLQELLKVL